MSLNLLHLYNRTRQLMLAELHSDVMCNNLHISPYLSGQGIHDFTSLLHEAIRDGNERTLAQALEQKKRIARTDHRRRPSNGYSVVTIPANAAQMIAEDAFNRYYIRAICLRALATGANQVVVYRAKTVQDPRPRSEELVETAIDPARLLEDLREHTGEATELGIPGGPISGISVYLPGLSR